MKTFVYVAICLFSLCFAPGFVAQTKINNANRAPSRTDLETLFGQPVNCRSADQVCRDDSGQPIKCPDPKGIVCFQNSRRILIQVKFSKRNRAETVIIYDGTRFFHTIRAAEEIIMIRGRGRSLKKADEQSKLGCESNFIDEYEFLSMHFVSKNCQGSMPGGVTINWKEK